MDGCFMGLMDGTLPPLLMKALPLIMGGMGSLARGLTCHHAQCHNTTHIGSSSSSPASRSGPWWGGTHCGICWRDWGGLISPHEHFNPPPSCQGVLPWCWRSVTSLPSPLLGLVANRMSSDDDDDTTQRRRWYIGHVLLEPRMAVTQATLQELHQDDSSPEQLGTQWPATVRWSVRSPSTNDACNKFWARLEQMAVSSVTLTASR